MLDHLKANNPVPGPARGKSPPIPAFFKTPFRNPADAGVSVDRLCSDSRVPPPTIFVDLDPGRLFVPHRNVANISARPQDGQTILSVLQFRFAVDGP